jgi:signal transduction histidine kinase
VLNLLSNAVKFTPEDGSISVSVAAGPTEVTLTVADTGIGIDPAFLPRIFERFVQAEAPIATRKGLGLGLAIARHIVEVHGGTLSADSAGPMQGARFTLTLPRIESAPAGA